MGKFEFKKQKISLKPKYKWSDLSEDLQSHFFNRGILSAVLLVAGILIAIFVSVKQVAILYFMALGFYILWKGFYLLEALYGNVLTFIGTVDSVNIKEKSINGLITKSPKYTFYGKSSLSMNVTRTDNDGKVEEAKFIVPISAGFEVSEGNMLIVYVLRNSVFRKNQNSYQVTNPILTKVLSS